MAQVQFSNNAYTTLSIGCASGDLTLTVTSSATFPAVTTASGNWFYACLQDTFANLEIVKVTNVTGTTWTVTRAIGGTSARAFASGSVVELRLTAETLTDIYSYTVAGTLQNSTPMWLTSVSGTNAVAGSLTPTLTSYAAGQTFRFLAAGANTGAVTLNINSLGIKNVTKTGTTPLEAGDIPANGIVTVTYDGTQFQLGSPTTIVNDTSSTTTQYPVFGASTSGGLVPKTSSANLTFKPSLGLLGLGTVFSSSTYPGVDIATAGGLYSYGGGNTALATNSYYSGASWVAKTTAAGALYAAGLGTHTWYSMASVSAGANQTLVTTLALDASGNLTATANVTAYSDERLKKNWRKLPSDFISKLAKVKSGTYDRKDVPGLRQAGVSAQALREVLPEAVYQTSASDKLAVAYGNAALAACVELAKEVEKLRAEVVKLKGKK